MVSVGGKNVKKYSTRTYSDAYFYFIPQVMKSEELYLYTSLSLFAEIGGYMGLLLGVSLFNVAGLFSDVIDKKIAKYKV